MSSNLKVDDIGSSSAMVSWDGAEIEGKYTLDLRDQNGKTLASVETEETSVTFEDLTQNTKYSFHLFAPETEQVPDFYTSIRIDHKKRYWLSIQAVEAYSYGDGRVLPLSAFYITSSTTHRYGAASQAMNGKITSSWRDGAMLRSSSNTFWQARLRRPTQLSHLRLYTHRSYRLDGDSTLTMTKQNGQTVTYSLAGEHAVTPRVLTFQEIRFGGKDSPVVSAKPKYKSVRFVSNHSRHLTLVEVEVYGASGQKLPSTQFSISSSPTYGSYTANRAMNGNNNTTSYRYGALVKGDSRGSSYWQASFKGAATEISHVKVYYWNHSYYVATLQNSKLEFTDDANRKTLFSLKSTSVQTITPN